MGILEDGAARGRWRCGRLGAEERRVGRDPEGPQGFRELRAQRGQVEVEGQEGGEEGWQEGGDLGVLRGGDYVGWRVQGVGFFRQGGEEGAVEDGAPDWDCL